MFYDLHLVVFFTFRLTNCNLNKQKHQPGLGSPRVDLVVTTGFSLLFFEVKSQLLWRKNRSEAATEVM